MFCTKPFIATSPVDPVAPVGPAGPGTGTVTTAAGVTTVGLSHALNASAITTVENTIEYFMRIPFDCLTKTSHLDRFSTLRSYSSKASMSKFKDDLGPALLARIKIFVAFGRPVEWQFVRDDEGRFRFSLCDQLTQLAIVCFYICLARPDVLALDPKLAKVERNLTLLGQFIFGVRIFRYENPHNSDTASRAHRFH